MTLYSAFKKLLKRKKGNSYYNSDCILTTKEKQSLIVSMVITTFPILIGIIVILVN